tara:strand:- start:61 stop:258 length:198 start_codon:yes stop_codon:yes gene_type:complete
MNNLFENLSPEELKELSNYVDIKAQEKLEEKTRYTAHDAIRDVCKTVTVTSTAILVLCCCVTTVE